ncbi:MAG TPA: alpha/beta hydrolase [Dehalococcoidales bacterium]
MGRAKPAPITPQLPSLWRRYFKHDKLSKRYLAGAVAMKFEKNKTDNQNIHYQTRGEGNKTIILAHGLPSSIQEWDLMSQKLVSNGYQAIALDLPGHGDSFKPNEIDFYSADTFYIHFKEWINHLNIGTPPVLLGHSFGGYLSLRYALDHQRDVRGLILIDPFLSYDQLVGINRFLLSYPLISVHFLKNAPIRLIKFFLWAGSLVRRKFRIHSYLSKSELYKMAVDFKRCSPNIAYLPKTITDITTNLADLNIPTLLIWGNQDKTLSVSWYLNIVSKLPNSTYKVLNAGHNPHLSNFFEVYPIVLEFLESIFSQ